MQSIASYPNRLKMLLTRNYRLKSSTRLVLQKNSFIKLMRCSIKFNFRIKKWKRAVLKQLRTQKPSKNTCKSILQLKKRKIQRLVNHWGNILKVLNIKVWMLLKIWNLKRHPSGRKLRKILSLMMRLEVSRRRLITNQRTLHVLLLQNKRTR